MGLNRIALRLATVEALAPTGASVFPTLAGDRVYDTALPVFDLTTATERFGFIQITTEDASAKPAGTGRDIDLAREERVRLAIEITYARPIVDGIVTLSFEADAVSTAMLDYFEWQVLAALDLARRNGGALSLAVLNFEESASEQAWDADLAVPLAVRRLTIECRIPRLGTANAAGTGFDRLPSPLREVALALPPGGYGAAIATQLAALIAAETAPEPLQTLGLTATLIGQAATDTPAATATITL